MIVIQCPNPVCRKSVWVPERYVGRKGRCKSCGTNFKIGQSGSSTPPTDVPAQPSPVPHRLGRFEIRERLGAGAFGEVYRALDPVLDREVALKVPHEEFLQTPRAIERFLREARAAAHLHHPHIVPIYDTGSDDLQHYIASAFIPGQTLAALIDGNPQGLDSTRAARLIADLAEALHYAHGRRIVHRDVKPSNVMIGTDGQPQLMDFGLARFELSEEKLTQEGTILGTPAYMAPEQARNGRGAGPASDQYSLGVVLYELLCGVTPFSGPAPIVIFNTIHHDPPLPSSLNPTIPRDLETVCLKVLSKEPAARYANCQELADDLTRWLNEEPVRARRYGLYERLVRWCKRNPIVAGSLGTAAAALVGVSIVSTTSVVLINSARLNERIQKVAAVEQKKQADEQKKQADEQRKRANRFSATVSEKNVEIERQLTLSYLDRGIAFCDGGDPARGIHWMVRALEHAPAEDDHLQGLVRTNLASWSRSINPLKCYTTHSPATSVVVISPDARYSAGSRDKVVYLWDTSTGQQRGQPLVHASDVTAVAFSADGRIVLTGSGEGVRSWDSATGAPLDLRFAPAGEVQAIVVSPDGRTIVTSRGKDIQLETKLQFWDAETGKARSQPSKIGDDYLAIAFSPGGRMVLTAGGDGITRFWHADTGEPLGSIRTYLVAVARFSPDQRVLVTGDQAGTAGIWELAAARSWDELPPARHDTGDSSTSEDGQSRVSKIATGSGYTLSRHIQDESLQAIAFGPDARLFAAEGPNHTARLFDPYSGAARGQTLPHRASVLAIGFSPDGRTLTTEAADGATRLWEVAADSARASETAFDVNAKSVAFGPDGRTVLAGGEDGARFWDAMNERRLDRVMAQGEYIYQVAMTPDGRTALILDNNERVRLWDTNTGEPRGPSMAAEGSFFNVFVSPDGRTVITTDDKKARLWDPITGLARGKPMNGGSRVRQAVFSPDGQTILTIDDAGNARLWETATGEPAHKLALYDHGSTCATFSPDGRTIVAALTGGIVGTWDAATGAPLRRFVAHQNAITDLRMSPDGRTIATGSEDRLARLWDATMGEPRGRPMAHENTVTRIAFSPDGRIVLTASKDGTARLWDSATGYPLGRPMIDQNDVEDAVFGPDGRTVLTHSGGGLIRLWKLVPPLVGDPAVLSLWCQWLTGTRMDPGGGLEVLERRDWESARQLLLERKGPSSPIDSSPVAVQTWHRREARESGFRNRAFTERWHLDPMVAEHPDDPELLARRARASVAIQDWGAALADYDRAIVGAPDDSSLWQRRRIARLQAGDHDGYRKDCAEFLDRFGTTKDPVVANNLARVCAMIPDALPDLAPALALAQRSVAADRSPTHLSTLAAILYRSGKLPVAVVKFEEAIQAGAGNATGYDWLFLAMAHHGQRNPRDARRFLENALKWIEKAKLDKRTGAAHTLKTAIVVSDDELVELEVLRMEAESMIAPKQ